MRKISALFYSTISSLIILELLLTIWTVAYRESLLTKDPLQQDLILRIVILVVFLLSLVQVYFLHIKGTRLGSLSYWLILIANSGATVYFKYILDFTSNDNLVLCRTLFSISFLTWTMFLLLGVLFKSLHQSRQNKQVLV
jgi:hypothetical protein